MTDPIRIPLVEGLEPRLADSAKDGLASNVFYDKQQDGKVFATKRPGLTSYISGLGQANGIYNWNNQVFSFEFPSQVWGKIVWNGTKFCAVTDSNTTARTDYSIYSTDGINWGQVFLPKGSLGLSSGVWTSVAWNGTVFCAISSSTNITAVTSSDATSWTTRSLPNGSFTDIASDGSRFVAIGNGAVLSAYSTDNGATWSNGNLPIAGGGWSGVAWNAGAGLFCAVSTNQAVYTSPTGAVWTSRTASANGRDKIASSSTKFVAIRSSSSNQVDTSTDGINWSTASLPSTKEWNNITWTGSKFIITSSTSIAHSSDGTTWSEVTLPILPNPESLYDTYYDVVAGNSSIIVVLSSGDFPNNYAYSTDAGLTWTLGDLGRFSPIPTVTSA